MDKKIIFSFVLPLVASSVMAQKVSSPDGRLAVDVVCDNGAPAYSVSFDGKECISKSARTEHKRWRLLARTFA